MRILHVITTLSVGGAETMLRNVAIGLADTCSQHVLSLSSHHPIGAQIAAGGIPVTALGARNGILLPRHFRQGRQVLREFKPEIVHTWMYHANVVGRWLLGRATLDRPILVTSVRGALASPKTQKLTLRIVRALDARYSADADAILFNSHVSADQHAAVGYRRDRSLVIHNGFDTRKFAPDPAARQRLRRELSLGDEIVLGLIARYEPVKGHDNFLRAAALLAADGRRFVILLVGRGCEPSNAALVSRLSELELTSSVRLLGERNDVPAIMSALDILVCPSLSESFPNAVGEGMACGLPTVVTDVGDCAFLVGDAGVVALPADPLALARSLGSAIALSPAERAAMGARARDRICRDFSMGASLQKYRNLYERLLDMRRSTPIRENA